MWRAARIFCTATMSSTTTSMHTESPNTSSYDAHNDWKGEKERERERADHKYTHMHRKHVIMDNRQLQRVCLSLQDTAPPHRASVCVSRARTRARGMGSG